MFRCPSAPAAVDVPAVEHAVVLQVDPRLVVHGGAQFLKRVGIHVRGGRFAEQRAIEQHGHFAIARFVEMAAVDRVLHAGLFGEQRLGRREQIDVRQAALAGDFGDDRRVAAQVFVALARIGPERVAGRLPGDRRDEHEPRRLAVCARILLRHFVEILSVRCRETAARPPAPANDSLKPKKQKNVSGPNTFSGSSSAV